MQVTQDGQITIPPDIQEQLGFLPGTEIELKIIGNTLQIDYGIFKTTDQTALMADPKTDSAPVGLEWLGIVTAD